jgi:Ni,Fe-hydrogenase I cytochrome b subunit
MYQHKNFSRRKRIYHWIGIIVIAIVLPAIMIIKKYLYD